MSQVRPSEVSDKGTELAGNSAANCSVAHWKNCALLMLTAAAAVEPPPTASERMRSPKDGVPDSGAAVACKDAVRVSPPPQAAITATRARHKAARGVFSKVMAKWGVVIQEHALSAR